MSVSRGSRAHGRRHDGDSAASLESPSTSFFIIHQSDAAIIQPAGSAKSQSPSASRTVRDSSSPSKSRRSKKKCSEDEPAPTPTRQARSASSVTTPAPSAAPAYCVARLDEERDDLGLENDTSVEQDIVPPNQREPALSILNRCGSAPGLPLHSSHSASVYSSSKKRLQHPSAVSSARQVTLQRSRLTPLPIDIRTGTLKRSSPSLSAPSLAHPTSPTMESESSTISSLKEQMLANEAVIASLKQRLAELERESAASLSARNAIERQNQLLQQENQQLQNAKAELQRRVDELSQQTMQDQRKLTKLAHRYTAVYSGLQKLADHRQGMAPDSTVQTVLQTLIRENQNFQRKLQVLEARHVEDKTLAANHEKKLKRLRAELEAAQHVDDSGTGDGRRPTEQTRGDSLAAASPSRQIAADAIDQGVSNSNQSATTTKHRNSLGGPSHVVSAEDYQYIDPNILKVLDKVDSQFSIANAISLSATLKKWLNTCLLVVCSTHVPTVLKALLKRACELLHCEHAAVFHVDHGGHKLRAVCSERGEESWELPLDKGILGHAARQNALCNVRRAYDDPRFYSSTDSITGIPSHEVLCIPIVHELQPHQRTASVFAVLQAWNTTHQKPFTTNDQILGSLLAIHVGTIMLQRQMGTLLLKANAKMHQMVQLPYEVAASSSNTSSGQSLSASIVNFVAGAEKKLAECLGIKQLRVFVLDAEPMKIWRVGTHTDSNTGERSFIRRYANVASSLCGLLISQPHDVQIIPDPSAESNFNDTVDIAGGAGGIYLASIPSPWSTLPLGMVQVARSGRAFAISPAKGKASAELTEIGAAAAFNKEREHEQSADDAMLTDLIRTFCQVFGGMLVHASAQQLHLECPPEILQAQLAILNERLAWLDMEQSREQASFDEQVNNAERRVSAAFLMEQHILDSIQRDKLASSHSRRPTPAKATRVANEEPNTNSVESESIASEEPLPEQVLQPRLDQEDSENTAENPALLSTRDLNADEAESNAVRLNIFSEAETGEWNDPSSLPSDQSGDHLEDAGYSIGTEGSNDLDVADNGNTFEPDDERLDDPWIDGEVAGASVDGVPYEVAFMDGEYEAPPDLVPDDNGSWIDSGVPDSGVRLPPDELVFTDELYGIPPDVPQESTALFEQEDDWTQEQEDGWTQEQEQRDSEEPDDGRLISTDSEYSIDLNIA